jgi:acetylornithine deacetylase
VLGDACGFVDSLNRQIQTGAQLSGFPRTRTASGVTAKVELVPEGKLSEGIACDLASPALQTLSRAIAEVRGTSRDAAYSTTGSLPMVRDLQKCGFDVQITGFGESRSYHAPNEQASLRDFEDGLRILEMLVESD